MKQKLLRVHAPLLRQRMMLTIDNEAKYAVLHSYVAHDDLEAIMFMAILLAMGASIMVIASCDCDGDGLTVTVRQADDDFLLIDCDCVSTTS